MKGEGGSEEVWHSGMEAWWHGGMVAGWQQQQRLK